MNTSQEEPPPSAPAQWILPMLGLALLLALFAYFGGAP